MNVEYCTKGQLMNEYPNHSHACWEIIVVETGCTNMIINGYPYKIGKSDVIILPPNTMHSASSNVEFSDIYVQVKELAFCGVEIIQDLDNSISILLHLLNKVMLEKEKNYKNIADSLLATICQYIHKMINVKNNYDFAIQLKNIIFNQFSDPNFSVKKAIEQIGFQQDYMRRCFKEETGKTPVKYLIYLRINLAKSLLVQPTYKGVEDVARKCGFKDSYYFSTCFKKHTGFSPSGYRNHYMET